MLSTPSPNGLQLAEAARQPSKCHVLGEGGARVLLAPQRDAFANLGGRLAELPGFALEDEHHFRDVYDHLMLTRYAIRRGLVEP